jgi:hypothetical protein
MRKFFPKANIIDDESVKSPFHAAKVLSNTGYTDVILVVGGDRTKEFDKSIRAYINHKDRNKAFYFDSFEVVSAGRRNPDADDVSGMSASKMREAVIDGDLEMFASGVPSTNKGLIKRLFNTLTKRMGIKESVELDELDMAQRRKMSRTAKRTSKRRMKTKERKKKRRKGSKEMKAKIGREVISALKKKMLKGRNWNELSFAERQRIEKKLKKIPKARVSAITKKMVPVAKKKERERIQSLKDPAKDINDSYRVLREPEILDRLVKQLKAKGMSDGQAHAIARSSLQKNGVLKKGSQELTSKGNTRNSMTAGERAKDRAAKKDGKKSKDYNYNPNTNTATQKEDAPRDYKKEYDKYHSSPKARADRTKRVLARRKLEAQGRVSKGDGNDVDHKNGNPQDNSPKNLRVMSKGKNRARDNNKWRT